MQAINPTGTGPESAQSNAVTPLNPVGAGRADERRRRPRASQSAKVSWTAPASDGGSAITGYTVTPYIGATAQTPVQVAGDRRRRTTVTGLTNGTAYTFKVTATNAVGTGPASAGVERRDARGDDLRLRHAVDASTPATPSSRRAGREVHGRRRRHDHGIRFYKAAANTGTHIGSLWTRSGTKLAR